MKKYTLLEGGLAFHSDVSYSQALFISKSRAGQWQFDARELLSGFYLAPAVQFTASPRVVLEASYQFPVVLNSGPLVLRTDRNLLVGLKYLY